MASPATRPKQSKHPHYDDPSAFYQNFPVIEEVTDGSYHSPLASIRAVSYFKMGKCGVIVAEPFEGGGWFMSVQRTDRYPTWDEMVWLRYRLIPDAARMANILPNLNAYINREDTSYKFVFTMEQTGWTLDPHPLCPNCDTALNMQPEGMTPNSAAFACASCDFSQDVNFNTWNEEHGNGATIPSSQTGVNVAIKPLTKGRMRIVGEAILDGTFPFDDIKDIMPNDSPFNRLDIIVLHRVKNPETFANPTDYRVFYIPGNAVFKPTAPILMDGDILLATLSVPSRWKSISDILITYPSGEKA